MFVIRKPTRDEFPEVVAIAQACLGDGYLSLKDYHDQYLVLILDDKIVGFCSFDFYGEDESTEFLVDGEEEQSEDAYIDSVAVLPEARNNHYGTTLVGAALGHLIQSGAHAVRVIAWRPRHKQRSNLSRCLERNGFEQIGVVKQAYAKGGDFTWNCTVCGPCVCECDAEIYRKELNT